MAFSVRTGRLAIFNLDDIRWMDRCSSGSALYNVSAPPLAA